MPPDLMRFWVFLPKMYNLNLIMRKCRFIFYIVSDQVSSQCQGRERQDRLRICSDWRRLKWGDDQNALCGWTGSWTRKQWVPFATKIIEGIIGEMWYALQVITGLYQCQCPDFGHCIVVTWEDSFLLQEINTSVLGSKCESYLQFSNSSYTYRYRERLNGNVNW